jgi:solute carrier family 25 carnitine/acylcarnitine transporter 20/29
MLSKEFIVEFVAGNTGGLCGILAVYPLDTAKIRMQTYNATTYRNMRAVFVNMVGNDGVMSLYRGLPSPALGFGLTFAASFGAYGHGCRTIAARTQKDVSELSAFEKLVAGAYTGLVQSPLRQVVERVKSVMQVQEQGGHGKSRHVRINDGPYNCI